MNTVDPENTVYVVIGEHHAVVPHSGLFQYNLVW